jgi:FtsH-binding integral membrane protein
MGTMRYMNIGLAVAVTIVIAGVVAFRDSSEATMQAMALVGMFVGLALGLWLDTRAQRRSGKRAQ